MLLFVMILLMGSFDIKEFIKKPAVMIVGAILILILLFSVFFGGGDGQDPAAKSVKNLSNRHESLVTLIDQYSRDVKGATLKANLSQVSIILTANKNEIDLYYKTAFKGAGKVTASVSAKADKDLVKKLDQSKIANNLDSDLKSTVKDELEEIGASVEKIKKANPDKEKLNALADKLIFNTQTMLTRINEG